MDESFSGVNSGRQTDYHGSPMMNDDGGVLSLFQQVLFFLLSLITVGKFPLEAFALLPPLLRRKLFLLLPILNLHRIERQCPVATKGITMEKVWEELFNERLCRETKWLAEPHSLKLRIDGEHCYMEEVGHFPRRLRMKDVFRVVLAVPFTKDFTKISIRVKGFKRIKGDVCTWWACQDCKRYKFYCPSKWLHHFRKISFGKEEFNSAFLDAVTILLEHTPLEIDFLSIGELSGLSSMNVNLGVAEFNHLLSHVHTLEMKLSRPYHDDVGHRSFIEALLNALVSNPNSTLQNLQLNIHSFAKSTKYCQMLINIIIMFFSPVSTRSDVVPFLKLKTLRIATKLSLKSAGAKLVLRKLVDVIIHQEELEVLELSSTCQNCPSPANETLFQAAGKCFLKPTFQCLTLEEFHVTTTTFLDIQHHFLVSFARREQKLILKATKIYSSGDRKNVSYSSENAACTKSLSVLGCSATDVGIFSTADIVSGILSHPGTKYVDMSGSLDHIDLLKLTASLEKGAVGTLKLLDLSDTDLSTIIVRVGSLLDAIFHLPHLDELELVLKGCRLQRKDLEQLYCKWEQESCGRKLRNRSCGQSLRKLCVCGNSLPKDKSNLQLMAHSLCHHACRH